MAEMSPQLTLGNPIHRGIFCGSSFDHPHDGPSPEISCSPLATLRFLSSFLNNKRTKKKRQILASPEEEEKREGEEEEMAAVQAAISTCCSSSCLSRPPPPFARRRRFKVTAMAPQKKVTKLAMPRLD